ncbi:2-iminobutanoate/2-iminopropanoate deaminase isoform X2 [Eretmochelys imbricata]
MRGSVPYPHVGLGVEPLFFGKRARLSQRVRRERSAELRGEWQGAAMATLIKRIISTSRAPAVMGPYSQAVLIDRTMYIAGQLGMDPSSGQLVPGGAKEEANQALKNIGEILKAADCDYCNEGEMGTQRDKRFLPCAKDIKGSGTEQRLWPIMRTPLLST